jgi:hypothetical protein
VWPEKESVKSSGQEDMVVKEIKTIKKKSSRLMRQVSRQGK